MKKKNKIDKEKLREFCEETEKARETESNQSEDVGEELTPRKPAYMCPACKRMLYSRKEACPHCNYSGYIPMSDEEIKRIRRILFWIILAIAIAVFIFMKSK